MKQFYRLHRLSIQRFLGFVAMWVYIYWAKHQHHLLFLKGESHVTRGEGLMFFIFAALGLSFLFIWYLLVEFFRKPQHRIYYFILIVLSLIPVILMMSKF